MGSILITVDEVKTLLNLSGSSTYDAYISASIPIVEDQIKYLCNDDFISGSLVYNMFDGVYVSGTLDYPVGLKLPAALMIKSQIDKVFNSVNATVSSETLGAYSVTFKDGVSSEIQDMLKPYRRARFK